MLCYIRSCRRQSYKGCREEMRYRDKYKLFTRCITSPIDTAVQAVVHVDWKLKQIMQHAVILVWQVRSVTAVGNIEQWGRDHKRTLTYPWQTQSAKRLSVRQGLGKVEACQGSTKSCLFDGTNAGHFLAMPIEPSLGERCWTFAYLPQEFCERQ